MKRSIVIALLVVAFVSVAFMITPSHAAMSAIQGTVYWYDQFGNLRPLPWAQVIAAGNGGEPTVASTTTDGTYIMWVMPGTYNVTASLDPGYTPVSQMVTVSPGGVAAVDFQLQQSGKPIPEYPSIVQPIMLGVATLAAALILRRRRVASLWSR
jgi:hypothetical protein